MAKTRTEQEIPVGQVISNLKAMGDERAIAVWNRLGMGGNYLGVNLTKLSAYAKKLKKNHRLALELWATGIHDARLLAAMIEEPSKATREQLECWIGEADFWDITNKVCKHVIAQTPFAKELMIKFMSSDKEFVKRSGYTILSEIAKSEEMTESELEKYLDVIERDIKAEKNWVKEGMNYALIAIGSRNRRMNELAQKAAERIGNVEVDYGESSCKAPDALVYLAKVRSKMKYDSGNPVIM